MEQTTLTRPPVSRERSAGALALYISGWLMAMSVALRLVLCARFAGETHGPFAGVLWAMAMGIHRDVLVALVYTLPWLLWLRWVPERWRSRMWHRVLFHAALALFWAWQVFQHALEFYFFEEFRSRFNTVSVDYLLYPHEVFVNIWESYPIVRIIGVCLLAGLAWVWIARRWWGPRGGPFPPSAGWRPVAVVALLAAVLVPTVPLRLKSSGEERLLNEFANNGPLAFLSAAITRHLDYAAFYPTMPLDEAYTRARRRVGETNAVFVGAGRSMVREMGGDTNRPRHNVVVLLEESLGSEFWGSLGRPGETLMPEMDKLAASEGLLFTHLYASGNRTVRGMEGVLSSFPPLPGDSIVVRDLSDHVETVARTLQRDGYHTSFFYGGRGLFDGTKFFATRNGYDRFFELKDIPAPVFTTAWGACDEDLYDRALVEFRKWHEAGQPFFSTVLTVSNHKPYTYPTGRIAEDPAARKREHVVKYTDYALGRFFRQARQEAFWTNTLFVVVADHGARVYGSEEIPIKSYEIPMVMFGPAFVKAPDRIGALGSSLDVAPTILGRLGRPYRSTFFGRDLLKILPGEGRVLMNHNRDIGIFDGRHLIVLGIRHGVSCYRGDGRTGEFQLLPEVPAEAKALYDDAIALFQVADDLYQHERFRVDR